MGKVLVTAALGNVGNHVVRECVDRGLTVRVAGQDLAKLKQRFVGLDAARIDFLERSSWAEALHGCDSLFLLRPPPLGDMEATLCPFVSAAYAAGVKHIVFLSVAGADRMRWVPHRKVELALMDNGQAFTILRPGFFCQNLQDAYRQDILVDHRLYVPAGNGRVTFIDVRDIAAVAACAFERPADFRGQALTLTGPEALTFYEVADKLSAALGHPIRYEPASIVGYLWHLHARRQLPWMQAIIQTVLHVGLRHGDAEKIDPTLARLLSRPPHTMNDYLSGFALLTVDGSSSP